MNHATTLPAKPDQKGLLLRPIPEEPGPGFGVIPGAGDGAVPGCMDWAEKLRLTKLPEDPSSPPLAQADDSISRATVKIRVAKITRTPNAPFLNIIFISPWNSKHPRIPHRRLPGRMNQAILEP
jgi:hypothetical protein